MLACYDFKIINNIPTRLVSGKTIDHFITNSHDRHRLTNVTLEIDPSISDHCALITSISGMERSSKNYKIIEKIN